MNPLKGPSWSLIKQNQTRVCAIVNTSLVLCITVQVFSQLSFFLVADVGLCFGFVMKNVLITQEVLIIGEQGSHSIKAFSVPHTTPAARRLGMPKEL